MELREELEEWLKDHGDCLGYSAFIDVLVFVDKKIKEAETKEHAEHNIENEVIKICESVKKSNTTDTAHKLWNLAIDEVIDKIKSLQGSPEPQNEKCNNIFSYTYNNRDGAQLVKLTCQKSKGHNGKHEDNGSEWG